MRVGRKAKGMEGLIKEKRLHRHYSVALISTHIHTRARARMCLSSSFSSSLISFLINRLIILEAIYALVDDKKKTKKKKKKEEEAERK